MALKKKCGIDRADLSSVKDETHVCLVFFQKGTDCSWGGFQHPPPSKSVVRETFERNGINLSTVEPLWCTEQRYEEITAEVWAEERAAKDAADAAEKLEARRAFIAVMNGAGLDPQDPVDRAAFIAMINRAVELGD